MKNLRASCHQSNKSSHPGTGFTGSIGCNIIGKFSIVVELELQGIALQMGRIGIGIVFLF
jgi:hypothetical protein